MQMVEFARLVTGGCKPSQTFTDTWSCVSGWMEHRNRGVAPTCFLELAMELRKAKRVLAESISGDGYFYKDSFYVVWYDEPRAIDPMLVLPQ
jgi:hypothetical protein